MASINFSRAFKSSSARRFASSNSLRYRLLRVISRQIIIRKKMESRTAPTAMPPIMRAERWRTYCSFSASICARCITFSSYSLTKLSIWAVSCVSNRRNCTFLRRIVVFFWARFCSLAIRIFWCSESVGLYASRMVSVATSNEVFTNTAVSCLEGTKASAKRLKNPFFLGFVMRESRVVIMRCCTRCWVTTESCSAIISSISLAESKLSFASLNTRSIWIVFLSFSRKRTNKLSVIRLCWSSDAESVSISRWTNTREKSNIANKREYPIAIFTLVKREGAIILII